MSEEQVIQGQAKALKEKNILVRNPFLRKYSTCPGNRIMPVLEKVYDEDLKKEIVRKTNTFDIYEFIQASTSESDIAMIQQQFLATGQIPQVDNDISFPDFTLFPKNIHEVHQAVVNAGETFDQLPDNVKATFSNNKDLFLRSLIDGTYQQKIIDYYSSLPKEEIIEKESEVK